MKYRIVEYGAGYVVQKSILGIIWFNVIDKIIVGSSAHLHRFKYVKFHASEEEAKKHIERLKNRPKKYRGMTVATDGALWYTEEIGTEMVANSEKELHKTIDLRLYQDMKDAEEKKRKKARIRVIKID